MVSWLIGLGVEFYAVNTSQIESFVAVEIYISSDGTCQSVYDESVDLRLLGPTDIRRASHVEPTLDGQWTADMRPLAGPVLGPFSTRSQALVQELAWLRIWFESSHGEVQV